MHVQTVSGLLSCIETDDQGNNDHGIDAVGSLLYVNCAITAIAAISNARLLQKGISSLHMQNMLLYVYGVFLNFIIYFTWASDPEKVMHGTATLVTTHF